MSSPAHDRAPRCRPGDPPPACRSISYCCVATGTMAPDAVIGVSGSSIICMTAIVDAHTCSRKKTCTLAARQNVGMPLYRYSAADLEPVDRTTLGGGKVRDRR